MHLCMGVRAGGCVCGLGFDGRFRFVIVFPCVGCTACLLVVFAGLAAVRRGCVFWCLRFSEAPQALRAFRRVCLFLAPCSLAPCSVRLVPRVSTRTLRVGLRPPMIPASGWTGLVPDEEAKPGASCLWLLFLFLFVALFARTTSPPYNGYYINI